MSNLIPKIEFGSGPTIITFDFPPKGIDNEKQDIRHKGKVSISKGGVYQTMTDHIEEIIGFEFSHLTEALKASLESFLLTHALLGKSFEYFFDFDDVSGVTVTLDKSSFKAKFVKLAWPGATTALYTVKLKFRRVVG